MKILVFGEAAWEDTNAYGNTLSNFFSGWKDDKFYHFFTRNKAPDNDVVSKYFMISIYDIVHNIIKLNKGGKCFSKEEIEKFSISINSNSQKEYNDKKTNKHNQFEYFGMELLWDSKIWIDKPFSNFITEYNPDIFFSFAISPFILSHLIDFLKKKTHCKIVLFVADDMLNYYRNLMRVRGLFLTKRFNECIKKADMLYGASQNLCENYKKIYKKDFTPLFKSFCPKDIIETKLNKPLRIVYTGNLFYGRDKTIKIIAESLKKINADSIVAQLEIYVGLNHGEDYSELIIEGTSNVFATRPFEEINRILEEADILLIAESFERKHIDYVHYSFSTKIVDYLSHNKLILAIGPLEDATIDYMHQIQGVEVIENESLIFDRLKQFLDINQIDYNNRIKTIHEFSTKRHDADIIKKSMRESFLRLIN